MSWRLTASAVTLASASLLCACGKPAETPASSAIAPAPVVVDAADTIYIGGDIVTVDDRQATPEALAVKGGKIVAVGSRADIEKAHKGAPTKVVDLAGKALLPGFLDAHSHYASSLTVANQVNVYAPPAGPGKDADSIVAELVKFRDANKVPKGVVIQAYGYDENVMPKGGLLNRDHLDKAVAGQPGARRARVDAWRGHEFRGDEEVEHLGHRRRRLPAASSCASQARTSPMASSWRPRTSRSFASLPQPTREQEVEWSKAGQRLYAAAGVTTAHEGATHAGDLEVMKRAAAGGAIDHRRHRLSLHHRPGQGARQVSDRHLGQVRATG